MAPVAAQKNHCKEAECNDKHLQWQELVVAWGFEGQSFETSTVASGAGGLAEFCLGSSRRGRHLRFDFEQLGRSGAIFKVCQEGQPTLGVSGSSDLACWINYLKRDQGHRGEQCYFVHVTPVFFSSSVLWNEILKLVYMELCCCLLFAWLPWTWGSQLTGMAGSLVVVVWRWRPEFAVLYQTADLTFIDQISSCEIVVLNCWCAGLVLVRILQLLWRAGALIFCAEKMRL